MINRVFSNWTLIRAAYLLIGVWVIVQSALEGQLIDLILGAWPAAMGLFAFGCAYGNCSTGTCEVKSDTNHKN
ncbi:hypothetical protein [Autumnicola psychrophila]|uniref:DUF5668 domain-containing protein n=1 Tax=Autumnicola psychrophila TaxID=3075592 RepID=A0ABU3DPA6_9FLAO|nr:hypothetical protein [Zunongwangia sp. F225]MDT0685548.1 hypothetical protein [Zunongwangia sp. F225]